MTRWYESTDHMEDRAVLLKQSYRPEELARLQPRRPEFDPEDRFTELVRERVRADDVVVDFGTGDATWLLANVAPRVRHAVGFDYGARRLWLAEQRRRELGSTNASFLVADGRRIPLRDGVASALINRRGPWTASDQFFAEGHRVLARGGLGLEIAIGEQNARELAETFGARWQMHKAYAAGRSQLDDSVAFYRRQGFEVELAESHISHEVFPSRQALEYRLITSPAIEAFDAKRDAPLLDRVIAEHGLRFTVHRLCLVTRKAG